MIRWISNKKDFSLGSNGQGEGTVCTLSNTSQCAYPIFTLTISLDHLVQGYHQDIPTDSADPDME